MKIVLPPRREPQSGGSGTLKNLTFLMIFLNCFLKAVRGMIFDDFGYHFGLHFGVLWRIFFNKILGLFFDALLMPKASPGTHPAAGSAPPS